MFERLAYFVRQNQRTPFPFQTPDGVVHLVHANIVLHVAKSLAKVCRDDLYFFFLAFTSFTAEPRLRADALSRVGLFASFSRKVNALQRFDGSLNAMSESWLPSRG